MRFPLPLLTLVTWPGMLVGSPAHAEPRVVAVPERVTAGAGESVSLRVEPEGLGQHLAASVGSLRPDPSNASVFLWNPPPSLQPQWALLLFWRERGSKLPEVAVSQMPIDGRTDLEVETEPLASVTVEVGTAKFGPVVANARGRASVQVTVPPDTRELQVVAVRRGRSRVQTLPLTPPASKWAAFFSPALLSARRNGTLVIAAPEKIDAGRLEVSVPESRLELLETRGNLAFYGVTPLPGARHLSAEVRARGASQVKATAEAEVVSESAAATAETPSALSLSATAGYFFEGGANHGLALETAFACALPFARLKVYAELSVGLRSASMDSTVNGLGASSATVLAVPIAGGGRVEILHGEAWHLDLAAGLGPMPFIHRLAPSTSAGFTQTGMSFDAHLGPQAAYRIGHFDLLAELRGALNPAVTSHFDARLGGLVLLVGGRFYP